MLNMRSALKNDSICKSLTGLTVKEFNNLLPEFEKAFMDDVNSKPRERKYGGGGSSRSGIPTFEDKLFFTLFYVKCYPTFAVCGFFYDRDRTKCQVWEKELLPILEKSIGRKCSLPKREITSCEDFIKSFPKIKEIFIDGTERRVQRPKDKESQKDHYSGKKKTHTKKNLVVVDFKKKVLILTKTVSGKNHDFTMFKDSNIGKGIPPDITSLVDKGFDGIKTEYPNLTVIMPKKKPRGQELTEEEKEENKKISSKRIVNEHALAQVKKYNSVSHVYRNKGNDKADRFMLITCGLNNYHIDYKEAA